MRYKNGTDICRCNTCGNVYPVLTSQYFKDTTYASYNCPSCGACDYEIIG